MINTIKYILIMLLPVLAGCEKDVKNAMVPEFVPKLVVTSFVSPSNKVNQVYVTANQRIFGDLGVKNPVGNISGWISDGDKEIPLNYKSGKLFFRNDQMKPENGKAYTIHVRNDQGLEAKGTCRVPQKYDSHLQADTLNMIKREGSFEWSVFTLRASFRDQPETENYFRFYATVVSYPRYSYNSISNEPVILEKDMFTDASFNTEGLVNIEATLRHPSNYEDSSFLKVYLFNTEKSYYLYHKSLQEYSDDNNPFREARPVYTNVEGGLGVITAYTCDSIILRIK